MMRRHYGGAVGGTLVDAIGGTLVDAIGGTLADTISGTPGPVS